MSAVVTYKLVDVWEVWVESRPQSIYSSIVILQSDEGCVSRASCSQSAQDEYVPSQHGVHDVERLQVREFTGHVYSVGCRRRGFERLLTSRSRELMRVKRGEHGAEPECSCGGNMISLRKPAGQRHRPAQLPFRKSWRDSAKNRSRRCVPVQWLDYSPPRRTEFRIPAGQFPHVGIVTDDDAARRVFSWSSRSSRPCISALLHTHIPSPLLALKASISFGYDEALRHVCPLHWPQTEDLYNPTFLHVQLEQQPFLLLQKIVLSSSSASGGNNAVVGSRYCKIEIEMCKTAPGVRNLTSLQEPDTYHARPGTLLTPRPTGYHPRRSRSWTLARGSRAGRRHLPPPPPPDNIPGSFHIHLTFKHKLFVHLSPSPIAADSFPLAPLLQTAFP
ncbi:hypothetical protein PR048_020715 [Dryococelus australis]|uniref:Uncharacterized protein n=1 Tax=Dryococelus australis TaxID=614101 RepID=A0ABQ9H758_9NEOP|nr:hypothetical protein PR048_020715 [Dryococelus australis]